MGKHMSRLTVLLLVSCSLFMAGCASLPPRPDLPSEHAIPPAQTGPIAGLADRFVRQDKLAHLFAVQGRVRPNTSVGKPIGPRAHHHSHVGDIDVAVTVWHGANVIEFAAAAVRTPMKVADQALDMEILKEAAKGNW